MTSPKRNFAHATLSTLAAVAVGCSAADARQAAPLPHTPQSATNRILHIVETGGRARTPDATQLRYVNPRTGVTYVKSWSKQGQSLSSLPKPRFGIDTSGAQIRRAIAQGTATRQGLTKIARQTALLLTFEPGAKQIRSEELYVDPQTDRPVVEVVQLQSGGKNLTVTSNWLRASAGAVSRVEAK